MIGTEACASSILCTVEILDVININLKRAKTNLLLSLHVPQFPDSQWARLLVGNATDFDQVISGIYVSADRVTTSGDWMTAFDSFTDAFLFIFPHSKGEMCHYAEHVKSFFKARPESEHSGVIAYDSTVHTRVGQQCDLLHTDFLKFQDLQIRFIFSPIGSSGRTTSQSTKPGFSAGGGRQKQSKTPCRNFNNGICPRSAALCYYTHICSKCQARDHVEKMCEKK
ncbi:hypothetical protein FISHEDRAFT_45027 [Fistulina hepatica ATCC 64428]|uniref:C3H1-type domain-containing protein n=1 Tax=Fistulina hepatica ATCC 64428 TaxID=1128425 RepID=A0A0D7AA85_9AGAR|nr:hypothetical protein FISHEDRAFT_45027 [Fistulina hepatica ATCC 64428]